MRSSLIIAFTLVFCASLWGQTPKLAGTTEFRHKTNRTWLFLAPPQFSSSELQHQKNLVAAGFPKRTLDRRRLVIQSEPPVRLCDLPPDSVRLQAITATGCQIQRLIRYLNAVTVTGDPTALDRARRLSFVDSLRPVYAYRQDLDSGINSKTQHPNLLTDAADYGQSWGQVSLVNLPAAHAQGYSGRGVIVGVQDTGFDNLRHRCFAHLDVLAAYDFVNNDRNVGDELDQGSGGHGSRVLSVIAALDSGFFIGSAPLASYVLTKTENTDSEHPIEEDAWVAGLWFHDSVGTQVLSSSVSYRNWYDYEDLDGATAVTSRAADSAAAAGIVIVNSAGNSGRDGYPRNKVGAPADAELVVTVGGVTGDSSGWSASSQGPTFDGRIKPDVVSMGVGVYAINNLSTVGYMPRNGTSYSCPMVAGIVALMLEAQRFLTPRQVLQILHETSSLADQPDTLRGWGLPNALAAVQRAEQVGVKRSGPPPLADLISMFPNPCNGFVSLKLVGPGTPSSLEIIDLEGRIIWSVSGTELSNQIWYPVNLSQSPAGCYFVRSKHNNRFSCQKLLYLP